MEKKRKFKKSILFSVLIPMIVVLLMQSALFVIVIYEGGTVRELKQSSMNLLSEFARSRSSYLENVMTTRWMAFEYPYDGAVKTVENILQKNGKDYGALEEVVREPGESDEDYGARREASSALNTEILNALTPSILDTIRVTNTTGAFVAFGTERIERKYGLYLRDDAPQTVRPDNRDIVIEVAPVGYEASPYLFGESKYRTTKFAYEEGVRDFFSKPYLAFRTPAHSNPQNYGWWSVPYSLNNPSFRVLTYSVPLVSPAGECYGVMGIEIEEASIVDLLPGRELESDGYGVYLMGRIADSDSAYDGYVAGNNTSIFDGFEPGKVTLKEVLPEKNVYALRMGKQTRYFASFPIKLYGVNDPFADEEWQVAAFVYEDFVTASAVSLQKLFFLLFGISLILGVGILCAAAFMTVRPIMRLTAEVRDAKAADALKFHRIGISEIDNLTGAIEQMSRRALTAQENLSKVIELSNMQIAAFEFDLDKNELYVSPNLARLMNRDRVETYDADAFFRFLDGLEEDCVSKTDNVSIYKFTDLDGCTRWTEIRFVHDETNPSHRLGVVADVTNAYLEKEQLQRELNFDTLTGIYNRRAFGEKLEKLFEERDFACAAFVMLDIDNLKFINDSFGHDFGDRYIRAAANIIVESLKDVPNKLYGRRSGDEFYALIYGDEPASRIRTYVSRIRLAFRESTFRCPDGETIKIRISGGISMYPDDATESGDLIKYADYAMYETKTSLKGEFRYFDRMTYEKNSYLLNNKETLYQLLENEDLDYYFQPIVQLRDGEVFAYEALMRPRAEVFSGPEDALRMARVHFKLERMERLTIFKTTQIFSERHSEFRGCKLFVNSLPSIALSDEDWEMQKELFGLDILKELVIEITENEESNAEVSQRKMRHIRTQGAQFALDDYGRGYNGEVQLLANSPDYIKIDMSLIRGVNSDRDRQRIVGDLVSFAHSKRILVIAEGVETKEEVEEVIRLDCDYAQGFWFQKPIPDPSDIPQDKKDEVRAFRAKYYRD